MHDYPTDEQLQFIRDYDLKQGPVGLIEHLMEIWHWPDYLGYSQDHRAGYLELHTGGWSGNEDIIEALAVSSFWLMYWQKSERGGHYEFEIPRPNPGSGPVT